MSQDDYNYAPMGWCPLCGEPSKGREKRPEGDDFCTNGHWYFSDTVIVDADQAMERRVRYDKHHKLTGGKLRTLTQESKNPDQVDAPTATDPGS